MEANDSVVCNKCTKYKENSGPDVGRTWMPLGSAHFYHAEKAAEYFLTVLGALS